MASSLAPVCSCLPSSVLSVCQSVCQTVSSVALLTAVSLKDTPAEPEPCPLAFTQTWAVKGHFQQSRRTKCVITRTATGQRLGWVGGGWVRWDGAEKKALQPRCPTSTNTPYHCYALLLHITVATLPSQTIKHLPPPPGPRPQLSSLASHDQQPQSRGSTETLPYRTH